VSRYPRPQQPAFGEPNRTADMRGYVGTQDSTISRLFGSSQKHPGKLCRPKAGHLRGQARCGAGNGETFRMTRQ